MKVEKGKIVAIEYTVKDIENTILDTNVGFDPVEYLHGTGALVIGLEKALEGKGVGETINVEFPPESTYGIYQEILKRTLFIEEYKPFIEIEEGNVVTLLDSMEGIILEKNKTQFVVDCNHPLAGKILRYVVSIKWIREARVEELKEGMPLPQQGDCCGVQGCC